MTLASQKLVEPVEPVESSVQELGRDDKRPLVAGASAAGIFLLFSAWIVLTVVSAMREMPVKAAAPVAAVPPPADEDAAPRPAPPSSNDTTEEDHEPAVV